MNRWLIFAAVIIVVGGMVALANRLGLFRPDSRWWQTCLYFTGGGVLMIVIVDVMEFGLHDFLTDPIVLAAIVLVGALGGALSGLWFAFSARRWPEQR